MSEQKKTFGEHIKHLRQNTRDVDGGALSLRRLAERINVSPTYLSKLERDIHPASAAVTERLAEALGVSKDALFARAEKISPDLKESFFSSSEPDTLASFIRTAAALPSDKLKMASRIIGAMHDQDETNDAQNNLDTTEDKEAGQKKKS